jgi:anti-sigma B factor antagonist
MHTHIKDGTLHLSGIKDFTAGAASTISSAIQTALENSSNVEIDFSDTEFLDSCGVGLLISVHKQTTKRKGTLRVMNPRIPVQQVLHLTRMHHLFEIVPPIIHSLSARSSHL